MTTDLSRLEEAISSVLRDQQLDLFDLELRRGVLCVTVSRPGGLGLDDLAEASRAVSGLLDTDATLEPDEPYELEVSSPGVERRLRRPEHFAASVGERVSLRTKPEVAGERRVEGVLLEVDRDAVTIRCDDGSPRTLRLGEIERARTVFDWRAALAADSGTRASNKRRERRSARDGDPSGVADARRTGQNVGASREPLVPEGAETTRAPSMTETRENDR